MAKLVPLTQGKFAIVSDWRYEEIMRINWHAFFNGLRWYAGAKINGKNVYMHRYIMNPPLGMDIHHIDGDTLCNADYNLMPMNRADHLLIQRKKIVLPYISHPDPVIHDKTIIPLLGSGIALVDEKHWDRLYANRWHLHHRPDGYTKVVRGVGLRMIYMARDVMEHELGRKLLPVEIVDHNNHNTSDNRVANLRITDKKGNAENQKVNRANSTTGFKGVTYNASRNKYVAQITHHYKHKTIGYYDTLEEAARAYDVKAIELFGDFAHTNFPVTDYSFLNVQA